MWARGVPRWEAANTHTAVWGRRQSVGNRTASADSGAAAAFARGWSIAPLSGWGRAAALRDAICCVLGQWGYSDSADTYLVELNECVILNNTARKNIMAAYMCNIILCLLTYILDGALAGVIVRSVIHPAIAMSLSLLSDTDLQYERTMQRQSND